MLLSDGQFLRYTVFTLHSVVKGVCFVNLCVQWPEKWPVAAVLVKVCGSR